MYFSFVFVLLFDCEYDCEYDCDCDRDRNSKGHSNDDVIRRAHFLYVTLQSD